MKRLSIFITLVLSIVIGFGQTTIRPAIKASIFDNLTGTSNSSYIQIGEHTISRGSSKTLEINHGISSLGTTLGDSSVFNAPFIIHNNTAFGRYAGVNKYFYDAPDTAVFDIRDSAYVNKNKTKSYRVLQNMELNVKLADTNYTEYYLQNGILWLTGGSPRGYLSFANAVDLTVNDISTDSIGGLIGHTIGARVGDYYRQYGGNVGDLWGAQTKVIVYSPTSLIGESRGAYNLIKNINTAHFKTASSTYSGLYNLSTGLFDTAYANRSELVNAGTMHKAYLSFLQRACNTGTIDSLFGLYIQRQSTGTKNWNFWSDGSGSSGRNYFGGWLGLNKKIPSRQLDVTGAGHFTDTISTDGIMKAATVIAGNIGVGTTAPVTELQVVSTSSADPRGIMISQYSTYGGARLHFRKARGTLASPTIVPTGDSLGLLRFSGYDGTNYIQSASIKVGVSGTVATNRVPTYMGFSTATDATTSVLTERMRIDNAGNVGIGTITPYDILHLMRSTTAVMRMESTTAGYSSGFNLIGTGNANWIIATNRADIFGAVDNLGFYKNAGTIGTKMILQNNGYLGINTTLPTDYLDVNGNVRFRYKLLVGDSTSTYSYINPGDAAWTSSSTKEIKRNIQDILTPDGLLDKILDIDPKTYQFKSECFRNRINKSEIIDSVKTDSAHWRKKTPKEINIEYKDKVKHDSLYAEQLASRNVTGFLAEDINPLLGKPNSKEINYTEVIAIIWKANQELIKRIKSLENRVAVLESKQK